MKLTTLILLLAISVPATAQLEVKEPTKKTIVGEVKPGGSFLAELYWLDINHDTTYVIMFKNQKYSTLMDIKSVSFVNEDNTVGKLYDLLKSFFSDESKQGKDYKMNITLGKEDVTISFFKYMGSKSVMIWTDRGYFYLTQKQLDKLFNKD